ncbi:glutamate synthase (NADPH/NADH) small chain [Propionibacterium cyclohexanicum]|uniref:Glutamate synthase (NADPH/NADH) small chain n=1 Tax=Propionibacterium cyclohexanicum TaxID=64702 RepID=A0A1H9Q3S3_9ACTN|nr:glutamate synthase subunit beta [Propionibacterium cyclohexanicum]SER55226.1 glutamate synthase (NADPH/NADH) small chain [Propionibacterium cyclohexanicum]
MADFKGFMKYPREVAERRPVDERVEDWNEVYPGTPGRAVLPIIQTQAARCMDCGIPFCHTGCPLGNLIPEWNDLVWRGEWQAALDRLFATNNFPEFTGRLCPAPCETSCVEGYYRDPVTIKNVEIAIVEKGWDDLRVTPQMPSWHTLKTVAVVGSGPAGLAVAQQLTRAGHTVVVYERADAIGGLLRYGIPNFKLEKWVIDRRLKQMRLEGTTFRPNTTVGKDITGKQLLERFDAVVLAIGSTVPRDLPIPGRELKGIHQALEYLPQATKALTSEVPDQITAEGKDVVVIGGGDTSNDCLGTALRQGARSVTQLEIMPHPPAARPDAQPWPTWPIIYRVASANEEGGKRVYSASSSEFIAGEDGQVAGVRLHDVKRSANGRFEPVEGSERELPAQLVLLAMGFLGPQKEGVVEELGVELDPRGNIKRGEDYQTNVPGVFVAGDAGRGQSLIVWAIAEGRSCAAGVDSFLNEKPSPLPRPIGPQERQMML